jgi:pyruvate formate lyase activating enzyme
MTFSGFEKTDLVNYTGFVAATVFTCGCNFRCPYCHNPEFVIQGSDQTYFGETYAEDEVLSYLQKRRSLLDALVVSGGEPTLHTDIAPFIRKVRELGLKVKLDTNGSRPDVLQLLLSEGLLDYVAMDVKAPFGKYQSLGFKDTDKIKASISILECSSVEHEFRTTCPKLLLSLEDFAEMAHLVGSKTRWYLQTFNPRKTLDPAYGEVGSYSKEELQAIAESLEMPNISVR